MAAKHPDIRVTLNAAGDDFRIIDHVIKALRRAGIPAEEIETFCDEAVRRRPRATSNLRAMGDAGAALNTTS
jgi:hypothetical protein